MDAQGQSSTSEKVVDYITKASNDALDTAKKKTSEVADKASDLAGSASEQAKTFASELERMGRANPLAAMAGALLVGVVIGLMGRGRS
jgi:ElaB/YqjD/DUF883 family membrane-anchored ribosome-binding protein